MSRTDKDRPYWVQCNDETLDREETHYHERGECDLAPATGTRQWWERSCSYALANRVFRYHSPAPRDFRHAVWVGPERVRERDTLREMAKEYNATGEISGDFLSTQHRHGANWYWA